MKVLVISNTCSDNEFKYIQSIKYAEKISPQQNYFSMLIAGLAKNPEIDEITCISARAIAECNCSISKLEKKKEVISDKVSFFYTRVISKNIYRNINNVFEVFHAVQSYLSSNREHSDDIFAIIDPLSFDITIGALMALKGIIKVGVITDIPVYIGEIGKYSGKLSRLKGYFKQKVFMKTVGLFQAYCYLTSAMIMIGENKPYCIIEGMVPCETIPEISSDLSKKKVVLYAGGLYEKFGINNLVKAASEITDVEFELQLYGEGSSVDYINEVNRYNPNIVYMGVTSVEKIKEAERNATLLVNPRPCDEEYTKYSFPSKTLEYMSSGRPILTTKLKGIPEEYYEYLYTINDNEVETIKRALTEILCLPECELEQKGKSALNFVCEYKNAHTQAAKMIHMVEEFRNGAK